MQQKNVVNKKQIHVHTHGVCTCLNTMDTYYYNTIRTHAPPHNT